MSAATSVAEEKSIGRGRVGASPSTRRSGLVIVNYGKSVLVEDDAGCLYRCSTRRNLPQVVSGDRVAWEPVGAQEGVIKTIEPRHTVLQRADGANRTRALAANIDQILIVAAPQPTHDAFLIDRYLIAAELAGATPLVVINKSDLLDPQSAVASGDALREYAAIGYGTLLTSAREDSGIGKLAQTLVNRTSILVGQSGVGKSSLINRLLPELDIQIGKLSDASGQGRHTTTTTTLYHLPQGGDLIDSPGVRDFRLGETAPADLARGFREFQPYLGLCRFQDCRHLSEPGCAVKAAMRKGAVSKRRLASYSQLANGRIGS
ncbi:MAG: ribosome small subunit-dependent GTPase A [Gammaproteobacteria bacterium]